MRKTTGFTWTDYKTKTKIAKELNKTQFSKNTGLQKKLVAKYKQNVPL